MEEQGLLHECEAHIHLNTSFSMHTLRFKYDAPLGTKPEHLSLPKSLSLPLIVFERVLGREREAKAVPEREKGNRDGLGMTCAGNL